MDVTARHAGRALVATVAIALLADAFLGGLTSAISSVGPSAGPPWWVNGHVAERSRWLVFALLLVVVARRPFLRDTVAQLQAPAAVWRLVGILAIVVPLLWTVALWIVQATIFTAFDRWDIDGLGYLSADYHRRVFAGYVPWLLGGVSAVVASRHTA